MSKIGKIKKVEDKKVINEDYDEEFSFKKFIGIIIIILVILGIFYFITTLTAKKQENNVERSNNAVIDNDMTTIGNMLSKSEADYYVLAYKNESGKRTNLDVYNMYIKDIKSNNDSFKIYKVNLSDAMNKSYIGTKNNITDNIEEFKLSDEVLLHIVNNSISESFIGITDISDKLSELKGE